MANSGSHTNGSQFFITLGPTRHLDNIHTVFGRVVGGLATLDTLEKVPTGKGDTPTQDIVIRKATVFESPYKEADALLLGEVASRMKSRVAQEGLVRAPPAGQVQAHRDRVQLEAAGAVGVAGAAGEEGQHHASVVKIASSTGSGASGGGVGKYLKSAASSSKAAAVHVREDAADTAQDGAVSKKQKTAPGRSVGFTDFSGW